MDLTRTAQQIKEEQGEYIDSISELVAICESDGFIPRYYIEQPNDKVDRVIQDLQGYTRSLVTEEMNLGVLIERAMKQIETDKESRANADDDDRDEDDILEDDLFNYEEDEEEFRPEDYEELIELEEELAAMDAASLSSDGVS